MDACKALEKEGEDGREDEGGREEGVGVAAAAAALIAAEA
jgi:hypothetical protein